MTAKEWIAAREAAFVEDIRTLVEINSVRTAPKPGMPFGEGGAAALAAAARMLEAHGYGSVNYENYALEADLGPAPDLMLLAHLDVVPAGDGWTREPFRLTREGDLIYGRGATDDKGPVVACIYALDACRAIWGTPKTGVRLVLGSGEETGPEDMDHYFSKRPKLTSTLSPDADYPLINIEKGRFAPFFTKTVQNGGPRRAVLIEGGNTQNIVPGKARALLEGVPAEEALAAAERTAAETGVSFSVEARPGGCEIFAAGRTAHAAQPEKGANAQTALIRLLCAIPFSSEELNCALSGLASLFPHGETDGASAGVAMQDEVSGSLTLNFGVLRFENGVFSCGADLRCPVCADGAGIEALFAAALQKYGFAYQGEPRLKKSHAVPESSRLVQTCLKVYEAYTGRPGACLAIGGGTYVHEIEGGVAFGVEHPGRDYRIHGADEYASVAEMIETAAMYADVIRALCYDE